MSNKIVYNFGKVSQVFNKWNINFPKIQPYYAVKCNPNPMLVSKLAKLGCNFDCASLTEINLVRSVIKRDELAERIIFANPCKFDKEIEAAKQVGIQMSTFDSVSELHKMSRVTKGFSYILRIFANDLTATCNLSNKYGAYENEWEDLIKECRKIDVNLKGVSFHVGSGAKDPKAFETAILDARKCFDLAESYGFQMNILDIGGGFQTDTLEVFTETINKTIDNNFDNKTELIAEPGRFFAEKSLDLYTTIIGKRYRQGVIEYYISDGIYGSFNCKQRDHFHPIPVEIEGEKKKCRFFGPTCDGLDVVLQEHEYPDLEVGQQIKWTNMGAYTIAGAMDFNGINMTNPRISYQN